MRSGYQESWDFVLESRSRRTLLYTRVCAPCGSRQAEMRNVYYMQKYESARHVLVKR